MIGPVLSLYPGIDLLGRGFELEGFCVVRGPDPLWGSRTEDFTGMPGVFVGVIAGTPCQDFSKARRCPPIGEGDAAIAEFARVVTECRPEWFLLENVAGVPSINTPGYRVQRFNLSARQCGMRQRRLRCFQFGSRDGVGLVIRRRRTEDRESLPCCMATEGGKASRRAWEDFCELQGLPREFQLPGWSIRAKYRAVGNGVPIPMARVVAAAIRTRSVTAGLRVCVCGCGEEPPAGALHAAASCRKRMERRRRDSAGVTGSGEVTPRGVTSSE